MDLHIKEIELTNFRNYSHFELDGISSLTIFVGPNAIGKTNIIEGIELMTALTSLKGANALQMTMKGKDFARVRAELESDVRKLSLCLSIQEGKKHYSLNGKTKRIQDLKGMLPAVVFSPDDLMMIKGSQSIKRNAIDALGSQLSSSYYQVKKDYEKILHQKNSLLKEECSPAYLESINEMMATIGAQLYWYRVSLFKKFSAAVRQYYHELTGGNESAEVGYVASWERHDPELFQLHEVEKAEAREKIAETIKEKGGEEAARKRALVGPHADKIEFFIGGSNASVYGSQGQQRTLVLAMKLAELHLIQEVKHEKPVLLLDDVMSELDESRRGALMRYISDDIQTFITTTNLHYFSDDVLSRARIIDLGEGSSCEAASLIGEKAEGEEEPEGRGDEIV